MGGMRPEWVVFWALDGGQRRYLGLNAAGRWSWRSEIADADRFPTYHAAIRMAHTRRVESGWLDALRVK